MDYFFETELVEYLENKLDPVDTIETGGTVLQIRKVKFDPYLSGDIRDYINSNNIEISKFFEAGDTKADLTSLFDFSEDLSGNKMAKIGRNYSFDSGAGEVPLLDDEHGEVQLKATGEVFYTDFNSTNGSKILSKKQKGIEKLVGGQVEILEGTKTHVLIPLDKSGNHLAIEINNIEVTPEQKSKRMLNKCLGLQKELKKRSSIGEPLPIQLLEQYVSSAVNVVGEEEKPIYARVSQILAKLLRDEEEILFKAKDGKSLQSEVRRFIDLNREELPEECNKLNSFLEKITPTERL